MKRFLFFALVAILTISASAQQVTTIYFLENAPMRHTINPAFQPYSNGYVNFTPLGWMSGSFGNNSLSVRDIFMPYRDPVTHQISTVTPLHPDINKSAFMRSIKSMTLANGEVTLGFLNFGFRVKDNGYVTIGFNERISSGVTIPKSLFEFVLDGGMRNVEPGALNTISFKGLGPNATVYTEISGGYSHQIDAQWTVGGKVKLLLGQAKMSARATSFHIDATTKAWDLKGDVMIQMAGPMNYKAMPEVEGRRIKDIVDDLKSDKYPVSDIIQYKNIGKLLTPSGYGAAIDLGFTYKPIENLQISAALNDLGFISWTNARTYRATIDTAYTGIGMINYGDPAFRNEKDEFSAKLVLDSALKVLGKTAEEFKLHEAGKGFSQMISTRLNIGVDANFWDNRVGVGIVSATRLYRARLYEELTLGASFRPVRWFNIACSYSLLNNGKFSNIGAGLSFMPYDGINMTLAFDYLPTSYAGLKVGGKKLYILPDKTKMFNLALGFSVCWGTNRKDKDKDKVWDKIDLCPNTPRGVQVDSVGCPIDSDHDGVPDYLDHCPGTPEAAIGYVDSVGCELDTDGDGVSDYMDQCPNTPREAWGKVDSIGCPIDSDGDGVPDYLDECPNTPAAAYGQINAKGCPLDTDGDGVPDYLDECPNTPPTAYGLVDQEGCPIDTDMDGIPDYLDECPNTPAAAIGSVDARGCEMDSDNDSVPDYLDVCPEMPGLVENKGCPEVKREVKQLLQKAMQGIEFETGKATIKKKSYALLDQIVETFKENGNYMIEVEGHTDNVGKAEVNKKLSQKRADAVKDYLIKKGIEADRLSAIGYGSEQPIADNKTKEGRAQNRRVEFKITFEEVHYETILEHAEPASEE